jgi:hypothetical protein
LETWSEKLIAEEEELHSFTSGPFAVTLQELNEGFADCDR